MPETKSWGTAPPALTIKPFPISLFLPFEFVSTFVLRVSDLSYCVSFTAGGFQVSSMIDGGVSFGQ